MRAPVGWCVAGALYAAFFAWYTGCGGPLSTEEIQAYMGRLAEGEERDPERLAAIREFLEADDGGEFVMVNAMLLHERPRQVGDVQPGETSEEILDRYMAYMWPALLSRACHPVIGGGAFASVEVWGVEGAERFGSAALMRYRSRRDMMEVVTDPAFDDAHQYKVAAIHRTVAFPIETFLDLGEPRLLVGLLLFSLAAAAHLLLARR